MRGKTSVKFSIDNILNGLYWPKFDCFISNSENTINF